MGTGGGEHPAKPPVLPPVCEPNDAATPPPALKPTPAPAPAPTPTPAATAPVKPLRPGGGVQHKPLRPGGGGGQGDEAHPNEDREVANGSGEDRSKSEGGRGGGAEEKGESDDELAIRLKLPMLDNLLAMTLGRMPKRPEVGQDHHFECVCALHHQLRNGWVEEFKAPTAPVLSPEEVSDMFGL